MGDSFPAEGGVMQLPARRAGPPRPWTPAETVPVISAEPYDSDPAHSGRAIVRGQLAR
ncbi:MAG: hypothetical protein ACRDP8_08645 [Actinopolymorphaceae bacterium]